MTLREQVEALHPDLDYQVEAMNGPRPMRTPADGWECCQSQVLGLIDAHRCALTDEVLSIIRENGDARVNAALDRVAARLRRIKVAHDHPRESLCLPALCVAGHQAMVMATLAEEKR